MNVFKSQFATSVVLLGVLIIAPFHVYAQSKVGTSAIFIDINSPRAIGMGGCNINLVSPESPLHNPASLGLFHLDHFTGLNFPNNTKLLSEIGINDASLKSWGMSVGASSGLLRPTGPQPINFSIGLAFSRLRLDYVDTPTTDYPTPTASHFDAYQISDYITGGLSVEIHRFFRVGFGYSRRNFEMLDASAIVLDLGKLKGNTNDYGLITQLRIHELVWRESHSSKPNPHQVRLELTPSYAVVRTSVGGSMSYENEPTSFPFGMKATNSGPAIFGALDVSNARLFTVLWSQENNNDYGTKSYGMEFGFADILFYRFGKSTESGNIKIKTKGGGVSLSGLIAWLNVWGKLDTEHNRFHRLIRKLDIRYDYAEREDLDKFYKLTVSLLQ